VSTSPTLLDQPLLRRREIDVTLRAGALPFVALTVGLLLSLALKVRNVGIGGPQYMIDDFSLLDGGFLILFGHVPPQHAYIETWLCGICSLVVFAVKTTLAGTWPAAMSDLFIPAALRDYYAAPDAYYAAYRSLMIAVDLATACVVYQTARLVFPGRQWIPVWVTLLFLFSYNTLWCALVGRPDTPLTLVGALGLYCYLRHVVSGSWVTFWLAAILFGIGAGFKMHGGFFTVFALIDMFRREGWRAGAPRIVLFGTTAVLMFVVSDGSLLFDPLLYLKARWATYHDDLSTYLHWGQQFVAMLRGSGWVVLPMSIGGIAFAFTRGASETRRTLAVFSIGWLLIFGLTRQLRAYWMLPALPGLYMLAGCALERMPRVAVRVALAAGMVLALAGQTVGLSQRTAAADLDELRRWVVANVRPGQPIYLLGDSVLRLPLDAEAMRTYQTAYTREAAADLEQGMPFVERHLKNWEETATLRLFDMLGYNGTGYRLLRFRELPPDKFGDLVQLDRMDFLIIERSFPTAALPGLDRLLLDRFTLVAERRSEGGDGSGLLHRIYRRTAS